MFTGIVEDVGEIKNIVSKEKEVLFTIKTGSIDVKEVSLGESIAVNGTCLTVIAKGDDSFTVEASYETLRRTNLSSLGIGSKVNLERSLKVGGRLGGHILSGHIDGVGRVESLKREGESLEVWFEVPKELSKYIVEKGSIAVDGVSLTVNQVKGNRFSVVIIPYTQRATTFSGLKTGDLVNIECDILAKYVEKLIGEGKEGKESLEELIKKF
ncbi:MAG: riboflavin synthase subunit alpha [Deltaproteobacteria bacterium]|jgi:riboflavin synthase|nr:MAG: riboflavin synthase subunit alpha [Deltaproteobacteria bacterium]